MPENDSMTLDKLKMFISEGKVQGWVSHVWFNGLRSRFPFEFLQLSQEKPYFKHFRTSTKDDLSKNFNLLFNTILESKLEDSDVDELYKIRENLRNIYFKKKERIIDL